jgi:hypothetical protein
VVNIYFSVKEKGTTMEIKGRKMTGIPTGTTQEGPTSMGFPGRRRMIGLPGKSIIKSIRKVVDTSGMSIIINEKIMINTMMMMVMIAIIVVNATRMITWMITYSTMTTAPKESMGKARRARRVLMDGEGDTIR